MKRMQFVLLSIISVAVFVSGCGLSKEKLPVIIYARNATRYEMLAVKEVQRYVYVRTGELLEARMDDPRVAPDRNMIVVAAKDRNIVTQVANASGLSTLLSIIDPGHCLLKTGHVAGFKALLITAGDDKGTLYAAYRFARSMDIRFSLNGDIIPTEKIPFVFPELNEDHRPVFDIRGLLPLYGEPEGPDWWSGEEYRAVLAQMPKLGLNFIGFHSGTGIDGIPDPAVWIGLPEDIADSGAVKSSYPSRWSTALEGENQAGNPVKTGDYHFGANLLFEKDTYGAEVMDGFLPLPKPGAESDQLFNRTGPFLGDVFGFAKTLGIETGLGTDLPLRIPPELQQRLKQKNMDPAGQNTQRQLYRGMFERLAKTGSPNYFWLWTPESWNRDEPGKAEVSKAADEINTAIQAKTDTQAPFALAVSGWRASPAADSLLLDRLIPRELPVCVANEQGGMAPVDNRFAFSTHPVWVIPWLEDDEALTMPQLWVGRLRADAAAAKKYKAVGLIGLHWRIGMIDPNIEAFAEAAWHQETFKFPTVKTGAIGANEDQYRDSTVPAQPIANTEEDTVYQTMREDLDAYRVELPNGTYRVTLKFCETKFNSKNQRVFSVEMQGKTVINDLDILAFIGKKNAAIDYTFENVKITDGILLIDFIRKIGPPALSGIVIQNSSMVRKINCSGPAVLGYEADSGAAQPRDLVTVDFYLDWARHQFGTVAAEQIADVFQSIDGNLPRPTRFQDNGQGSLYPDNRSWDEVSRDYGFVSALEQLRPQVTGAGNLSRFDYWLNSFGYMQAAAHLNCFWGEFDAAMEKVQAEHDPARKSEAARGTALPVYREMVAATGEMMRRLLASASSTSELGAIADLESNMLPRIVDENGKLLAAALGQELPAELALPRSYEGNARLIVPVVRTLIEPGEPFSLKAIVLDSAQSDSVVFSFRPLGSGEFVSRPFTPVAGGVYEVKLAPEEISGDFEYTVRARTAKGAELVFPPDAPDLTQTVVVMPE